MKKRNTKAWCDVFLEKLKTLDHPVNFTELKNLVWDDPDARPSTDGKKHTRFKMTNMPLTVSNWGKYCKNIDNVITKRKVSTYLLSKERRHGTIHYQWCEHLDFTDTLDGAVCNDCQTEVGE